MINIITGHQPLYLPWLGFFHKLSLCDIFIYMDDVQLLDRDFNQRNKIITPNGKVLWLTVPLARKKSQSLNICDIIISHEGQDAQWQGKHFSTLQMCYGKTPYFKKYKPFFEWLYKDNHWTKLADLNYAILLQAIEWFHLDAKIIIGSSQKFTGKKSNLLLEHACRFKADILLTGEQGADYIVYEDFAQYNIDVVHQKYKHPRYNQGKVQEITHLSFVDLLFRYGDDTPNIAFVDNLTKSDLCKK